MTDLRVVPQNTLLAMCEPRIRRVPCTFYYRYFAASMPTHRISRAIFLFSREWTRFRFRATSRDRKRWESHNSHSRNFYHPLSIVHDSWKLLHRPDIEGTFSHFVIMPLHSRGEGVGTGARKERDSACISRCALRANKFLASSFAVHFGHQSSFRIRQGALT